MKVCYASSFLASGLVVHTSALAVGFGLFLFLTRLHMCLKVSLLKITGQKINLHHYTL